MYSHVNTFYVYILLNSRKMVICEIVSPQSNMQKKIMPEEKEMSCRLNEIDVKCLESKYARKTNHAVQVKHVLGG